MGMVKKHSLWLRPFGEIAFKLEQKIKELGQKHGTPVFEPHITLLGSLQKSETELIQLTDTLASSLHPFDVVLTNAGCRDEFYRSIFVHVKKSRELMDARNTAERLFNSSPEEEFMPHLSLMYSDFGREEKERILNTMGREFHLRFPVQSILLIQTEGKPDNWKKIHSADFRKS